MLIPEEAPVSCLQIQKYLAGVRFTILRIKPVTKITTSTKYAPLARYGLRYCETSALFRQVLFQFSDPQIIERFRIKIGNLCHCAVINSSDITIRHWHRKNDINTVGCCVEVIGKEPELLKTRCG